jgi:hypothetical protein
LTAKVIPSGFALCGERNFGVYYSDKEGRTMPITLTPEQERRVTNYASRTQKPIEYVLDDLITTLPEPEESQPEAEPQTWGAKVWAEWEAEGVIGTFSDRPEDSPELARKFARIAEGREEK